MMLIDRKEEMDTLFKEILYKKLNVRESELIARNIAVEKARRLVDPELIDIENHFKEKLGTRVRIEKRDQGGVVKIDFFNKDDLRNLLSQIIEEQKAEALAPAAAVAEEAKPLTEEEKIMVEDKPKAEEDENLYSVSNFSI
jgi:hypothetical protein